MSILVNVLYNILKNNLDFQAIYSEVIQMIYFELIAFLLNSVSESQRLVYAEKRILDK